MVDHVVILAGGTGTRLWPASLRSRPKQFMDPGNGRTLIESTLRRAVATGAPGELVVVTHVDQVAALGRYGGIDALPKTPVVIAEPQAKNTAPAVALAISYLSRDDALRAADETVLVLASDHVIAPDEAFVSDVERADQLAREGRLVTFGITPTRPETGYGYILAGEQTGPGRVVDAFKEKPDAITAQRYLDDGGYLWNSGMFVFRIGTMADELQRLVPEVMEPISELPWDSGTLDASTSGDLRIGTAGDSWAIAGTYLRLPNVSLDRAVMEKSGCAAVVEAGFRWNDVGSWDEMAKLHEDGLLADGAAPAGPHGAAAELVLVEAEGNFVFSDLPVALCGVEGLCVVVKNGRVLVTKRERTQLVKKVVDRLENRGRGDLV
ncbi:MAG: mannose-1-phosphate guanylyltransferase [Spirochaetaceae bacterium]|nr:MAG: mannose-1-phosphate guanylyltransferase [Spirochaetaceae bacterium]